MYNLYLKELNGTLKVPLHHSNNKKLETASTVTINTGANKMPTHFTLLTIKPHINRSDLINRQMSFHVIYTSVGHISKFNLQMPFKCVLAEITAVNVSHSGREAEFRMPNASALNIQALVDCAYPSDPTIRRILFYSFDGLNWPICK